MGALGNSVEFRLNSVGKPRKIVESSGISKQLDQISKQPDQVSSRVHRSLLWVALFSHLGCRDGLRNVLEFESQRGFAGVLW